MNQGLRQITNLLFREKLALINQKEKKQSLNTSIDELITLNLQSIDFGQCLPGSVHERKLGITLKQNCRQPKIISISILCDDQQLNDLPQYIFGVRKENNFQYYDEFKFKAIQKGTYNFMVGVKTPNFYDYNILAKLIVTVQNITGELSLDLKQISRLPIVSCSKELINQQGFRLIKLAVVKNKSRKQTKIAFRCSQNLNLTLIAELLGMDQTTNNQIDIRPKTIQVGNKGAFVLSFITSCPLQLDKHWICIRKVLVFKIKETNFHFHFPVEVVFYPEGPQKISSQIAQ